MPYLLTLSIGPVQDFIAAARKTRDLWFGSELLSRTAREVARAVQAQGAELVFPAPRCLGPDDYAPVPNKIVAVVPGDLAALHRHARQAAQTYLTRQGDAAIAVAGKRGIDHAINQDVLREQLAGFLEIYVAWYRYDGEDGYAQARLESETLLAGRKALRDFAPAKGREGVPKSMLDGGRETVIRQPNRLSAANLRQLDMKRAELLDGVSLVKRLAPLRDSGRSDSRDRPRFVSVSRIAIDPLLRRLEACNKESLDELNDLARRLADRPHPVLVQRFPADLPSLQQFARFPFDTELFYDDASRDEEAEDDEKDDGKGFYEKVRAICTATPGVSDPPPYLAVLVADGDRVGATIGSMMGPNAREKHQRFSQLGGDFARRAGDIVAGHHGALVYSGGDDVLAFLPLDTALACAGELQEEFGRVMGHTQLGLGDNAPTMRVGLAISHFDDPLRDLLQRGRDAERAAKRTGNALAVALHVRSAGGAAVTVAHSWTAHPLQTRWGHWIDWYRRDKIPDGAAYELRALARELRRLVDVGHAAQARQLAVDEARRILARKRGGHGTKGLTEGEIDTVLRMIRPAPNGGMGGVGGADGAAISHAAVLDDTQKTHEAADTAISAPAGASDADDATCEAAEVDRLETLVGEMIIARHFARVCDVAEGPLIHGKGEGA